MRSNISSTNIVSEPSVNPKDVNARVEALQRVFLTMDIFELEKIYAAIMNSNGIN